MGFRKKFLTMFWGIFKVFDISMLNLLSDDQWQIAKDNTFVGVLSINQSRKYFQLCQYFLGMYIIQ